jgi:hypothetical protein
VTQRALPPGALRRRAVFGLLDADGWTWAGLKAAFWFLFLMFMLGVVPNWAYYFTTGTTLSVGYNFASIINLCPADNEDLPCPAPEGAMKPWQASPPELALPAGRAGSSVFQSGSTIYLIGGSVDGVATDDVLVTGVTEEGNLIGWTEGPTLPAPRTDASLGLYGGVPYLVGGLDDSGAPTDTVYQGVVQEGVLTGWVLADGQNGTPDLTLPRPLSGAGVVPGTGGFVLVGGRDADQQLTNGVFAAWADTGSTRQALLSWQPLDGLALPEPRADAVASALGDFIYVIGGEGPDGPTDSVFRLQVKGTEPATDLAGNLVGWAIATGDGVLPEPRAGAIAFSANGAIYAIGGIGADGTPQSTMYWIVPDPGDGDYSGWQHLEQADLAVATAYAPMAGVGVQAFVFGGQTADGASPGSQRAVISPRPPFFQLGIAGATIPALGIGGEVGQQLGYMAAMGVGMTNFVILIILGVAFSRPDASKRVLAKLSRGRLPMPPEERYRP